MPTRLVLPVWGPHAKLLNLQRKHGAAQLAQSRPALSTTTAVVRQQGPMLPSGSQPGRKSAVVRQAVGTEIDADRDSDEEADLGQRLCEAVFDGDWDEVADLIAAGAPTEVEMIDEATALHHAVKAGELGIVKLLLQHKADPNAEWWGAPPLVCALYYEWFQPKPKAHIDPAIVRALVAAGADPDMYDVYDPEHFPGYTMMHLAALENTPHIITILGEMGANTEVMARGETPLHVAATNGNVQAVEALLDWGADVNFPFGGPGWETIDDPGEPVLGSTPLHMAALGLGSGCNGGPVNWAGRAEVASILLAAGADISAKDAEGRTALEVARGDDVKAVLQAAIAEI